MAKPKGGALNRLLGKKVVFSGRFGYGQRDNLAAMAEAHQALVVDDLDESVCYLVLADLNAGIAVRKRAASLNKRGGSIQELDPDGFEKVLALSPQEVADAIRQGSATSTPLMKAMRGRRFRHASPWPTMTLTGEEFGGVDLSSFDFRAIELRGCSFAGSTLTGAWFSQVRDCDFSGANAAGASFKEAQNCRFHRANLEHARFGGIEGNDFTLATLKSVHFDWDEGALVLMRRRGHQAPVTLVPRVIFERARLQSVQFVGMALEAPVFNDADLTGAVFATVEMPRATFRGANLTGAQLRGAGLTKADFSAATLTGVDFTEADLTDARFGGADLNGACLRGAKLTGVDFQKVRNYDPSAWPVGVTGPGLAAMDALAKASQRLGISFHVRRAGSESSEAVQLDACGGGIRLPASLAQRFGGHSGRTASYALMQLAHNLAQWKVCYETVDVTSTKSPKSGKELRELVIAGIAEAFAQEPPEPEALARATREFRAELAESTAADRERRERVREMEAKREISQKRQIEKKIAREVGKVTDIATFLKALELRADKQKIDKATKMLKASGFQLFNDVTETHLNGVVKSQTDPDLVYACRIESDGSYACCTQNLNICGGLRGSICKHLLVLIIGLVKAGELDPSVIDSWVAKSGKTKPELNKETMGEIFIRYKGAEAGEVDWRPTETVPEDYYAL